VTELDHDAAAVAGHDAELPQVREQAGVVAVAEERLRVRSQQVRVEVREHPDLILAADTRDHGRDVRIGEGGVQVGGPVGGRRTHHPRRGVLDRDEAEVAAEPAQAELERQREDAGQSRGR
jgi:hypothetical protein